jgi:hypothetical protein
VENLPDIADHMNTTLMLEAALGGDFERAEYFGLRLPQVPLKLVHLFGPGFCIRELHIPAGTFVVGHAHKDALSNMLVKGTMQVCSAGRWSKMEAPLFFVGTPGRKAAIALSDSIWQNILVTDETDIAKIEELFIETSEEFKKHTYLQLQGEQL